MVVGTLLVLSSALIWLGYLLLILGLLGSAAAPLRLLLRHGRVRG